MKWDWERFYDNAYNWVLTADAKLIAVILLLLIGILLIRFINRMIKKAMERRNLNPSFRYFLENLIAIILQIMVFLAVMEIAGIKLTFLTAILTGLAVAAGLALSGTLQNFVSGILILILRPYRVGDAINTQARKE